MNSAHGAARRIHGRTNRRTSHHSISVYLQLSSAATIHRSCGGWLHNKYNGGQVTTPIDPSIDEWTIPRKYHWWQLYSLIQFHFCRLCSSLGEMVFIFCICGIRLIRSVSAFKDFIIRQTPCTWEEAPSQFQEGPCRMVLWSFVRN